MQGDIFIGIFLIIFGLIHIFIPQKVSNIARRVYKSNPLFRNKKQLNARASFVVIFGIFWTLAGAFLCFFG